MANTLKKITEDGRVIGWMPTPLENSDKIILKGILQKRIKEQYEIIHTLEKCLKDLEREELAPNPSHR